MAVKPIILDNDLFFSSAKPEVASGCYRKYVNKYPDFLKQDDSGRAPSSNTCKLVLATTWNGGQIGDITPHGETYLVFTYQDHAHTGGQPHFNKMFQCYSHNASGDPFRITLERGIDDHMITELATGTSYANLESEFNIPSTGYGPISELIDGGTSIDPYPKTD